MPAISAILFASAATYYYLEGNSAYDSYKESNNVSEILKFYDDSVEYHRNSAISAGVSTKFMVGSSSIAANVFLTKSTKVRAFPLPKL